jgi:hypothetical protein
VKRPQSFSDFIASSEWDNHEEHFQKTQGVLRSELAENSRREREFRAKLTQKLNSEFARQVKTVTAEQILAARSVLASGDVVALDGTLAKFRLMSGTRSQIGIVAVNYKNDKTTHVTYVTEATYSEYDSTEDVFDYLRARKKSRPVISDLVLRATMAFWERKYAIQQAAKWRIVHGELFPFELRSGLGELHALPESIKLFEEIAAIKTIGSVVSDSTGIDVLLGFGLQPNQYLVIRDLNEEYSDWLHEEAHFSKTDEERFESFLLSTARDFRKCVYRVGDRPFLFYAHKEYLEEFGALLVADASLIRERGFPVLVDYADTICSSLFRAGDFERRIEYELSLQSELLREQSERAGRKR